MEQNNFIEQTKILKQRDRLLERIDKNGGWINHIDAFELISVYVETLGIIYTTLPIEEELSLMYYRLKGYKVFEEDFSDLKLKKCIKCGLSQKLTDFGKNWNQRDGRTATCKICLRINPEEARKLWEENELKKKMCPSCERTYSLNNFFKTRKCCVRCNNKQKEHEPKTTYRDMLEERGD